MFKNRGKTRLHATYVVTQITAQFEVNTMFLASRSATMWIAMKFFAVSSLHFLK